MLKQNLLSVFKQNKKVKTSNVKIPFAFHVFFFAEKNFFQNFVLMKEVGFHGDES